jgi:anti-anti-sigma factor
MLNIITHKQDGITVLHLEGQLISGAETAILRNAVRNALQLGDRRFVFDLSEVTELEPDGFGDLMGLYATVFEKGGDVKLCGNHPVILKPIQLTRLNLKVFSGEPEARRSFAEAAVA